MEPQANISIIFSLSLAFSSLKYIDGKEGIRSIELVNAIYYSALKGKKIFLPLKNFINKFDKKIENEIKS